VRSWAFGDDFAIKNDAGEDVYIVDGKAFSLGKKLSFQDMGGHELAFIQQKMLSFKPTYQVLRNGQMFASVEKEFTFFKNKFTVDIPGPNDYEVTGNFFAHEFTFTRSGRTVATVSKEYYSWSDTYGVDIIDGEDDILILATAVVIDLVIHNQRNE
jgi:uncharacterized protein YxjI